MHAEDAPQNDHEAADGEPTKDAPLSIRWDHSSHWDALRKAIPGLSRTGAGICIALWSEALTAGRPVSYSRTPSHYARVEEERGVKSTIYTLHHVKGAFEHLEASGLLADHFRQAPGCRGWQSYARASDELVRLVSDTLGPRPRLVPRKPWSPVVVRDAAGASMALPDTRAVRRMEARVEAVNEAMRAARISHGAGACYTRIFHGDLKRGGRWYADGMSWQNMPKAERKKIEIDGEFVVELDYKTNHAAMAYADAGVDLPEDAYRVAGWERKLSKVAFLTMVNARTERAAIGSLAHSEIISLAGHRPKTKAAVETAARLVADVTAANDRVRRVFFSDAGAGFMRRDAEMAGSVIGRLMEAGVTCLAVHDSFLVKASERGRLEEVMRQVADENGLAKMEIEAA